MLKIIFASFAGFIVGVTVSVFAADASDVQTFFASNKVGNSPDFAFVKDGVAGPDHLITIHGYGNDGAVCRTLVEEYNSDESSSVIPGEYKCVQLNE
ncbi:MULTISPECIES: hypothetical protein [unclassified Methylophaga]|mgnify:CR=1 FL=1|uniref:hypothetical protein n=1 Tax=unclassified Methylophaga TaxID=2629249 RepID=UPI000C8A6F4E|nr:MULTISPECIES: hypothetical protein [unclassified Methylophaga]MAP27621.1 hypothetical protein [Methylophaga sp.]HBX60953.1 hypothetical protein [Methylophaga sp.]HCN99833.1 hypothetical protein [Methylophaga sp.]